MNNGEGPEIERALSDLSDLSDFDDVPETILNARRGLLDAKLSEEHARAEEANIEKLKFLEGAGSANPDLALGQKTFSDKDVRDHQNDFVNNALVEAKRDAMSEQIRMSRDSTEHHCMLLYTIIWIRENVKLSKLKRLKTLVRRLLASAVPYMQCVGYCKPLQKLLFAKLDVGKNDVEKYIEETVLDTQIPVHFLEPMKKFYAERVRAGFNLLDLPAYHNTGAFLVPAPLSKYDDQEAEADDLEFVKDEKPSAHVFAPAFGKRKHDNMDMSSPSPFPGQSISLTPQSSSEQLVASPRLSELVASPHFSDQTMPSPSVIACQLILQRCKRLEEIFMQDPKSVYHKDNGYTVAKNVMKKRKCCLLDTTNESANPSPSSSSSSSS